MICLIVGWDANNPNQFLWGEYIDTTIFTHLFCNYYDGY